MRPIRSIVTNLVDFDKAPNGADLSGADLSGADLSGADLSDLDKVLTADLSGVDKAWIGADLSKVTRHKAGK